MVEFALKGPGVVRLQGGQKPEFEGFKEAFDFAVEGRAADAAEGVGDYRLVGVADE